MDPERWRSIEERFDALAKLPLAERAAHVVAIEDEEVRREVESLLEHDGPEDGTNATGMLPSIAGSMAALSISLSEERFGPYRITGLLGRGGMGDVYRGARDDEAFHKQVAIKVLQAGLFGTVAGRERFHQERQILAGLEHPNIARLLDGGETPGGFSYIVLEFVDGNDIVTHCRERGLDRDARLRLFLQVCAAVQFAHQNLVVHRDLKPSNIFVTKDGSPKLLDFGIARLIDADKDTTATAAAAMTPSYASPEQVRGQAITTTSDVYSLGVVLYELLTGRLPYKIATLSLLEIDRAVCETAPTPPAVSPDLDRIVLMALRKEPSRRYSSVEQFAADIQRFLDRYPVIAQDDTLWYRSKRYCQRHWAGVLAAAIALTAVCGGTGAALFQARIAQQRFNDVRKLANSFLFDFDAAIATVPGTVKAREMVVNTSLQYLGSLARSARGDAALERELAQAYDKVGDIQGKPGGVSLGRLGDALASYRRSLELYRDIEVRDPAWRVEKCIVQAHLAWSLRAAGEIEQAVKEDLEAASELDQALREKQGDLAVTQRAAGKVAGDLASIYGEDMRGAQALDAARRSLAFSQSGLWQITPVRAANVLTNRYLRLLELEAGNGNAVEAGKWAGEMERQRQKWLAAEPENVVAASYGLDEESRMAQVYDSEWTPSLGDTARALEHVRRGDALLAIMLRDPNDSEAKAEKARQLRRYSWLKRRTSPEEGVRDGMEALRLLEEGQTKNREANDLVAEEIAAIRIMVAGELAGLGRGAAARAQIGAGLAAYRELNYKTKGALYYQRGLTRALARASDALGQLGDTEGSVEMGRQAAEMGMRLEPLRPREVGLLWVVGAAYVEYGRSLVRVGRGTEGRGWFERDARIWVGWGDANPYVVLRRRVAGR